MSSEDHRHAVRRELHVDLGVIHAVRVRREHGLHGVFNLQIAAAVADGERRMHERRLPEAEHEVRRKEQARRARGRFPQRFF